MSKKECDTVTDMVGGALPYHMDLPDSVRNETQRRWEKNEVKILCATIAFGKTVNKANVRFVIHHTLPQSLEQYERQCALAGTDGQLSHCTLLYSFNDHLRVLRLIKEDIPKPPPNVMAMKEGSLKNVLRYCENVAECRRKKLAAAFDEKYSAEQCIATAGPCTICEALMDGKQPLKLYDFTGEALAVFASMRMLRNTCISYMADIFRGCLTKKRVKQTMDDNSHGRLPFFGLGSGLTDTDCQRFMQKLVIDDYLYLRLTSTRHMTVIGYAALGKKGSNLLNRYKQQENVPPNERVAPAELEDLLLSHPDIEDCAVVGISDPMSGELPFGFVVKKEWSSLSEKDVQEFVKIKAVYYKHLKGGVEFIDKIPKSPSGKILRRLLRERLKNNNNKLISKI
ncbi:unnamed protein product [Meloidogyne enterolobii]|uniref:Uncharacterized protein n=1 Tax=Meloidogyne enterolobii TaxID=390850 RepID=A0ACB0ZHM2_MELEN